MGFCPLFRLWDFVLWDFVLWDFVRRDYVLWDFVLWDSVPDSFKIVNDLSPSFISDLIEIKHSQYSMRIIYSALSPKHARPNMDLHILHTGVPL